VATIARDAAMSRAPETLVVRQHERRQCAHRAYVRVESEGVTLGEAFDRGGGWVPVTVTDVSEGGLGIRTGVFLPKRCRVSIRLEEEGAGVAGVRLVVRRAVMLDRGPTYYLGLSFGEERGAAVQGLVSSLMRGGEGAGSGGGS
jgi:hypothetical protein